MAGKRIEIMDLRTILQLKKKGFSNRKISDYLGVNRNTINVYVKQIKESEFDFNELLNLSDVDLSEFFPNKSELDSNRFKVLSKQFNYFKQELKKTGCTKDTLWQEYKEKHPDGYGKSQFNHHLNKWLKRVNGSLKLRHKAGDKLYIDFTGKKLSYVDKNSGEVIDLEVFVAILPASSYTFVYAVKSQKIEDVIEALNECLEFIGGVPLAIVPDNMKTAVVKSHKYEPTINRSLRDFARHYDCSIFPTRAYSPQDKALVENAVKLVYQRIYYPLNKEIFFSLSSINQAIKQLLHTFNKVKFTQRDVSREEEFLAIEKSALNPLPSTKYELRSFKRLTVQKMGHVYLSEDKHYYSVPYTLISKRIMLVYDNKTVEIFANKERVALHQRSRKKGGYSTQENHLSSSHKAYSQWSLEYFQNKAQTIGKYTHQYITELILNKKYPETAYKQAQGILSLTKQFDKNRLEKACGMLIGIGKHSFYSVEQVLKNKTDQEEPSNNDAPTMPKHHNVRGSKYYA